MNYPSVSGVLCEMRMGTSGCTTLGGGGTGWRLLAGKDRGGGFPGCSLEVRGKSLLLRPCSEYHGYSTKSNVTFLASFTGKATARTSHVIRKLMNSSPDSPLSWSMLTKSIRLAHFFGSSSPRTLLPHKDIPFTFASSTHLSIRIYLLIGNCGGKA